MPRKTEIGKEVAHVTHDLDTTLKVKRSKVKGQLAGVGAYCGGLPHSLLLAAARLEVGEAGNVLRQLSTH